METVEGNKLIAIWRGATFNETTQRWEFKEQPTPYYRDDATHVELKYHSDWNWLMGVVEKIRTLKVYRNERELSLMSRISIGIEANGHDTIYGNKKPYRIHLIGSITLCHTEKVPHHYQEIEAPHITKYGEGLITLFEVIVEFIIWFNANNGGKEE